MSYHIPREGEEVVFVDVSGELSHVNIGQVIDEQAGVVKLAHDTGSWYTVRYVDPNGATEYESMTWHYPNDDISRIGKASPSKAVHVPEYARSYMKRK